MNHNLILLIQTKRQEPGLVNILLADQSMNQSKASMKRSIQPKQKQITNSKGQLNINEQETLPIDLTYRKTGPYRPQARASLAENQPRHLYISQAIIISSKL